MKFAQDLITLSTAASRGDLKTIELVYRQGFPLDTEGQESKRIPLHWAALNGQVTAATYLVTYSRKESIDHQDKDGCSPLILSVLKGGDLNIRLSMIECLLGLGANPLLFDNKGKNALMYIIPIRDSVQAKENSTLAEKVREIITTMKDFAIKLAKEKNQYLIFNADGSTAFYSKVQPDPSVVRNQYVTFPIVEEKHRGLSQSGKQQSTIVLKT